MKGDLPGSNLDLFSAQSRESAAPPGFRYGANLVQPDEETALVAEIEALHLSPYEFRGIAARRRVISFGPTPGYRSHSPAEVLVMPSFLQRLRSRAAVFAGRSADDFAQALVTEYSPGTPIGWHRDRAHYGIVVGVSLLSAATLRFRRCQAGAGWARHAHVLEPRSLYVLSGAARDLWQHSIPAVASLRYSVTFRTLRSSG